MNPQKRVGALLQCDVRGHSGDILRAQPLRVLHTLGDILVVGLYRLGETQVAQRVFVGTVDQRGIRQRSEARQRMMHLCRGAFEQAPATGSEQRVTAEQQALTRLIIGNVPQCMARHGEHGQFKAQHLDAGVVFQSDIARGNVFRCRPVYPRPGRLLELSHAADVILVMVGNQNVGQLPARIGREPGEDGRGIARIDHGAVALCSVL